MKRANSKRDHETRRMAGPTIRTETSRAVNRSIVYAAIGLSILLPGLPKRACAQMATQIKVAETAAGPAAASTNGLDYVAWMGKNNPGNIWYSTSADNGQTWGPQQNFGQFTGTLYQTTQAPALAAIGYTVYLAWQDAAGDIYYSICDSSSTCTPPGSGSAPEWSTPKKVCAMCTSAAPALAAGLTTPYIAWTTASGTIEVETYSGGSWAPLSGGSVPASPAPTAAPAMAVYNYTPYLAWVEGTEIKYATYMSPSWSAAITITGASSSVPPALGVYQLGALKEQLYIAWYTSTPESNVYWAQWDDSKLDWYPPAAVFPEPEPPSGPPPPGPETPALNYIYQIPPGLCAIGTYNLALVYATPVTGQTYFDIGLSPLLGATRQNGTGCSKQ